MQREKTRAEVATFRRRSSCARDASALKARPSRCIAHALSLTKRDIARLERAYLKAHNAEMKAVAALPENAPKAMTDRCWALAAAANKAYAELARARDAFEAQHPTPEAVK